MLPALNDRFELVYQTIENLKQESLPPHRLDDKSHIRLDMNKVIRKYKTLNDETLKGQALAVSFSFTRKDTEQLSKSAIKHLILRAF